MIHFNDFMENKLVLQYDNGDLNNTDFYRYTVDLKLISNDLLTVSNDTQYCEYWFPITVDKIDGLEVDKADYVELYINGSYSSSVDTDLELVLCATHSTFSIRFYFNTTPPEIVNIRYNAYLFPIQFKHQIANIPFQTDTHTYTDGVVELL